MRVCDDDREAACYTDGQADGDVRGTAGDSNHLLNVVGPADFGNRKGEVHYAPFLALAAFAASTLCITPIAQAQTLCGPRTNLLDHLARNHKEQPSSIGLTTSGKVIEVLTSSAGSWTIIVTNPNGTSCLVIAGEEWQEVVAVDMPEPGA